MTGRSSGASYAWVITLACLGGCGRLGFDNLLDAGTGDPPSDANVDEADARDERAPLVRYRINEAAAAQMPTALRDDSGAGVDLGLNYVGGSPAYAEDATGNRFLRFSGPDGNDTGGGRVAIAGTPLAALHGAQALTLEAKYTVDACIGYQQRIFGFSNGGNPATAGWLLIRENQNLEFLAVRWLGEDYASAYSWGVECPLAEPRSPGVVHWVIETSQAVAEDRVRAYLDGVRMPVVPSPGLSMTKPFPSQNVGVDLVGVVPEASSLVLGTEAYSQRTANQRIWYAAVYGVALTDNEILAQAAALAAADD